MDQGSGRPRLSGYWSSGRKLFIIHLCCNKIFVLSTIPGGSKPNFADLAVFGVLRPIRHLRAGKDMAANTGIGAWYQRMESAVGEPARFQA